LSDLRWKLWNGHGFAFTAKVERNNRGTLDLSEPWKYGAVPVIPPGAVPVIAPAMQACLTDHVWEIEELAIQID